MGSKLSTNAVRKLDALEIARRKWGRVHSLVEKAASQPETKNTFLRQCQRESKAVSQVCATAGYVELADAAADLAHVVRRSRGFRTTVQALREQVVSVKAGIEAAQRTVYYQERLTKSRSSSRGSSPKNLRGHWDSGRG